MKSTSTSRSVPVMFLGDLNVAHRNLDAYNFGAKHLDKQAGLTKEERDSFTGILDSGFKDCFRDLHPTAEGYYSYWSMRAGNRAVNKGLRLDYFCLSEDSEGKGVKCVDSYMDEGREGSDHGLVACVLEVEN